MLLDPLDHQRLDEDDCRRRQRRTEARANAHGRSEARDRVHLASHCHADPGRLPPCRLRYRSSSSHGTAGSTLKAVLTPWRRRPASTPEIILVDNGSSDGTVDFVRSRFPKVRVVALGDNLGFAGGNNAGAREARGQFLAFLNNDTIPDSTWLRALRDGIDASSRFLLATSRIVYMHDCFGHRQRRRRRIPGRRRVQAASRRASRCRQRFRRGVWRLWRRMPDFPSRYSRSSADSTKTSSRRTKTWICRTGPGCGAIAADTSRTQSSGITEARHSDAAASLRSSTASETWSGCT